MILVTFVSSHLIFSLPPALPPPPEEIAHMTSMSNINIGNNFFGLQEPMYMHPMMRMPPMRGPPPPGHPMHPAMMRGPMPPGNQGPKSIWVRSRRCGCLVTWFCYQMIAKPGNKTAAPS